ncbi:hypothetical protein NDU88_004698 [Pleurodeles waltl]|uniref:RNase H type-1 domain-containing protein n=1 Tax=Pleurodeles waltl TaxID=8319 RepID=A0AAV7SJM0_PLEWA|nr:hypothetical protein NDU88_004698 [Pleurodeles waltl]
MAVGMERRGRSIAFLEFFPLIVAVCLWGGELSHSRVLFRVDNLAVVQMVNRQSAREAGLLQLLRVFVLHCLRNDIQFSAKHVPCVHNDIADALSRSQWERFHGLTTGVALRRIRMPKALCSGFLNEPRALIVSLRTESRTSSAGLLHYPEASEGAPYQKHGNEEISRRKRCDWDSRMCKYFALRNMIGHKLISGIMKSAHRISREEE